MRAISHRLPSDAADPRTARNVHFCAVGMPAAIATGLKNAPAHVSVEA